MQNLLLCAFVRAAMKHSEQRQRSDDYDQQHDDRLVKAAYDFNLKFAAQFTTGSAGSSSDAPPPAAALPPAALPPAALPPAALPPSAEPPAAEEEVQAEEDVYEVDAILEEKVSAGKKQDGFRKGANLLYVRWVGWADPTWELASNVGKAAIDEFEERKRSGVPPPPPPQRNTSRILLPVRKAELRSQLEGRGARVGGEGARACGMGNTDLEAAERDVPPLCPPRKPWGQRRALLRRRRWSRLGLATGRVKCDDVLRVGLRVVVRDEGCRRFGQVGRAVVQCHGLCQPHGRLRNVGAPLGVLPRQDSAQKHLIAAAARRVRDRIPGNRFCE